MKNETVSETDETFALIYSTARLIRKLRFDFLKITKKGRIVVSTESEKFTVTIKLERKKEIK